MVFPAAVLISALIIAGIVGCGLPSYPALYSPKLVQYPLPSSSELIFIFSISGDDDPSIFEGIELYYKLYTRTDVDEGEINRDTQKIVDRPTLENNGFRRLIDVSSGNAFERKPVFPPDFDAHRIDDKADIYLDFSPLIAAESSMYPTVEHGDVTISLGRNVSTVAGGYDSAGFTTNEISTTDGDIPADYVAATDSVLYISLYVLAYGNDASQIEFNIYSQPVYAGYIQIPGL